MIAYYHCQLQTGGDDPITIDISLLRAETDCCGGFRTGDDDLSIVVKYHL